MKELIVLIGPPGSGKSTYALEKQEEGYTRISQDEMGKNEHWVFFKIAVEDHNCNIVLDRMNFSKGQRQKYVELAKSNGYKITFVVFHVPYEICLERCLARKDHPTIKDEESAKSALHTFFTKYEKPDFEEVGEIINLGWDKKGKAPAVWVDIDGTIANIEHRRHFVKDGQKNWKAFFEEMDKDELNHWCAETIRAFKNDYYILFCSGRPEDYRGLTETWLKKHDIVYDKLFMRKTRDSRQDCVIKEIILDFEIKPQYDLLLAIDDREQVVQILRKRGVTVLQCDEGKF